MKLTLHSTLHLLIVVTFSTIAALLYMYLFSKIKKQKTPEAAYVTLFFIANTLSLLIVGFYSLFDVKQIAGLIILLSNSLYLVTAFALRQAILLRNKLDIVPLYQNKKLYLFLFLGPFLYSYCLFYHVHTNYIARIMGSVLLITGITFYSLIEGFKDRVYQLNKSDKFLIIIVASLCALNVLVVILLYILEVFDIYRVIFLYVQIVQTSILTMTFIIVFMLDTIHVQYKSSVTDSLTGLYKRKYFTQHVTELISDPHNLQSYSLIFMDIDFFKKVNDTYGHDAGDIVIQKVATLIQDQVGIDGIVARFGGEEFAVFYTNKNSEKTKMLPEKIRQMVESNSINYHEKNITVTISIGVTTRQDNMELEHYLKQADFALYQAKDNGRNQVCFY